MKLNTDNMLVQCCTSLNSCALSSQRAFLSHNHNLGRFRNHPSRRTCKFTCLLHVGFEDIAQVVHNKVLIAAGVSAAIGQLSKPVTGCLLYGKDFDLKAAFQAGGFPSTHSSCAVAAATCLALERGFSDSFFGLTVVYAGLAMYDAQGVRREVGVHAKALNRHLAKAQVNSTVSKDRDNLIDGQEGAPSTLNMECLGSLLANETKSYASNSTNASPLLLRSSKKTRQTEEMVMPFGLADDVQEGSEKKVDNSIMFKESIGHTEVEVVAGALLGFLVSLAVSAIM